MFTKSYTSLRRLFALTLTLLLLCVSFSKGAEAQATPPVMTGSVTTSLSAPSGLGTVVQTALDSFGDWLVLDYVNGALYEYPANGGAMITLAPPGTLGGKAGYQNPGIILDSFNNIYVGGNFNNCLELYPYNTTTNTWPGFATLNTTTNTGPDQCGSAPFSFAQYGLFPSAPLGNNYFQPWGVAMLPNNVLAIGSQDLGNFIFTLPILYPGPATCSSGNCSPTATPGSDNTSAGTLIVLQMTKRPNSVAADKFGNIYFVEDTGGLPGAYMVPAGSTNLASDTAAAIVRIDPNLANVTAVASDPNGNVYLSDSQAGVFMVPNPSGTPSTKGAVILTTVPATGQVSVDAARGILYVPTTNGGLSKVKFNAVDFGATPTGAPAAASQSVLFTFNGSATPASFEIQEAGVATPDFTLATGGTCAAATTYAAQSGCTENVTLSPLSAGNVVAKLLALDASGHVLGSINLHGTGTGSAVQVLPGGESAIGAGLKKPSQVAVDAGGNTYVADTALGAVEVYPKGYGAVAATSTVGAGLTAPTGVAVDGGGDVFIADSGNVLEVPIGATGLNVAGQVILKSGLGTNLQLAADVSHLYISDPTNHRVVKLGNPDGSFGLLGQTETDLTGFNAPSAVAVDASGDLYVADGPNLIEVTPTGTQTTLLTSLAGATGLAVDPSGSVYVAEPGGTVRIPNQGGALTPSAETTIASNVTDPTSVAIDSAENQYIADGTADDVEVVNASASTNFGTLSSTSGTQSNNYTVLDAGNSALNVTGFSSTPDYSETATTCTGTPVAVDATCSVTITFNPGPGDQGTLAGEILIQSDAANSPVGVNVTGVGASLAASTTTISVKNATVDGAPAVITVAPTSGTGASPTGLVLLTITGTNLTTPVVVPGTLTKGTVTLTPPQLAAGTYTFSAAYQGDRTYGTSTASTSVTVAVGAVTLVQTPLAPALNLVELGGVWYVLGAGTGSQQSYDPTFQKEYYYNYNVTVAATDGIALIGQPVYNNKGALVGENYGSITYQGAPYSVAGGGCAPVNVQSNGNAPLGISCLSIDNSNTSIVDLESTYTITPVYGPTGTGATDCNPPYTASPCAVNPNYATVTGTPITVTALRNPVVAISSNPTSLSIAAGSTATATLTLTSILGYGVGGAAGLLNNYSLPVQLTCDGLPAYATCSFSYPTPDPTDPQSVDVGPPAGTVVSTFNAATNQDGPVQACTKALPGAVGGCFGPGTVVMTITTNVPAGVAANRHGAQSGITFAAMFGLGLLGIAFGKKKSRRGRIPALLSLLVACAIFAGISGCSTAQLGTTSGTVSPAGTYSVLITAKQVGSQLNTTGTLTYGNSQQVSLPFTMNVTIQ